MHPIVERSLCLLRFGAAALIVAACGGGGGSSGSPPFPTNPPAIAMFTPTAGSTGTQVRIEGIQFAEVAAGNTVRFNGVDATVVSASSMEIVATVPAGATTGRISVLTAGGSASSLSDFTVITGSNPGATWTTRLQGPDGAPSGLAWNGTRLVSVGTNLIQSSRDAKVWTPARTFSDAHAVAWDGKLFVAVGGNDIYTSSEGLVWTLRATGLGSSTGLYAVSGSGSLWVAVGAGGTIRTSPDGITWTTRTSGTTERLDDVVWSGTQFVAVGQGNTVLGSADGVAWTARPAAPASFVAIAASPTLLVATAGSAIYSSPDGSTWTERLANAGGQLNDVTYEGGRFVAVGFYSSATSPDGLAWTTSGLIFGVLEGVVHDGSRYVAIANNGGSAGAAFTSSDGLVWSLASLARHLNAIVRSPQDGRVVAIGATSESQTSLDGTEWRFGYAVDSLAQAGLFVDVEWSASAGGFIGLLQVAANQYTARSTDGATWVRQTPVPCQGALAASEALIVAVGTTLTGNCIATSPDGMTWTQRAIPSGLRAREAIWTGSRFVAFGDNGALATSPDGVNWTARSSNVTQVLTRGGSSPATIVVVGNGGTIVTSGDGVTWTPRSSGTTAALRGVTWTGSEFFVAGSGGVLLRSSDGVNWTRQATQYTPVFGGNSANFGDIAWLPGVNRLLLVGEGGLVAASP